MKYQMTFLLAGALVLGASCPAFSDTDLHSPKAIVVATAGIPATSHGPTAVAPVAPDALEGDWEYHEELGALRIALDKNGNGNYAWQNGRIITTSVSGRLWQGIWYQKGNDRQGEFEVVLSEDGTEAEGNWWYTRIGSDTFAPREKGGTCWLERVFSDARRVMTDLLVGEEPSPGETR
jgi:hypothetical protein